MMTAFAHDLRTSTLARSHSGPAKPVGARRFAAPNRNIEDASLEIGAANQEVEALLRLSPLTSGLREPTLRTLSLAVEILTVDSGAPIDNGKIDVAGLTFPVRGGIYASYAAADGQTSAEMVLPGSLLVGAERGDIASLMELRAITTTTIAQLSADQISVLIEKHPDFGLRLFLAASRLGGRQRNARLELSFTDATSRFAKLLLRLESSFGQHLGPSSWVEHGLTQTHLANLVSARRETINKAIAEFVRRDWIAVDGTSFLLLDRDRLQSRAR